jgi:hypothetical protein
MPLKKMKSIKNDVREIMQLSEDYKNSDSKLVAMFYYKKYGGKDAFEKKSAMDFLRGFARGEYPLPDSITRVRRKLQEQEPSLRGESYKKRHSNEADVRNNIHKL